MALNRTAHQCPEFSVYLLRSGQLLADVHGRIRGTDEYHLDRTAYEWINLTGQTDCCDPKDLCLLKRRLLFAKLIQDERSEQLRRGNGWRDLSRPLCNRQASRRRLANAWSSHRSISEIPVLEAP